MNSWRKRIDLLLGACLLLTLFFLVWTNWNYNREMTESAERQNSEQVQRYTQTLSGRLESVERALLSLQSHVYEQGNFHAENGPLDGFAKNEYNTFFTNLYHSAEDAQCFYLYDTVYDTIIFSTNTATSTSEKATLKKILEAYLQEERPLGQWYLVSQEDSQGREQTCFVREADMGRFRLLTAYCPAYSDVMPVPVSYGETLALMAGQNESYYPILQNTSMEKLSAINEKAHAPRAGSRYVIGVEELPETDLVLVLLSEKPTLWRDTSRVSSMILIAVSILTLVLFGFLIFRLNKDVAKPTAELLKASQEVGAGNLDYELKADPGSAEFREVFDSFNEMTSQIQALRIEVYEKQLQHQENELKLLRAQIKPHFYLNALTTIINMTYQNRTEDIRAYSTKLAKHMRYMLSLKGHMTKLGDELKHIENYVAMQDIRFPGSIGVRIDCDEAVRDWNIPFLTVFTVVENTIKHAMSLYSKLEVTITCRETVSEDGSKACRITVDDNGSGFTPEVLEEMNQERTEIPAKEHLGLSNIRYTLLLLYHKPGLMKLSNLEEGGARVEIRIPMREEETE